MDYFFIVIAAVLTTVMFAVEDSLSKKAVAGLGTMRPAVYVLAIGLLPILLYAVVLGQWHIGWDVAALALVAGGLLASGYVLAYKSVRSEMVTTTYTLNELQPAFLVLFGLFVMNEGITMAEALGMLVIFIGAAFLFTTERHGINVKLGPAAIANVAWALNWFFVIFAIEDAHAFAVPLLATRFLGMVLLLVYMGAVRAKEGRRHSAYAQNRHERMRGGLLAAGAAVAAIVAVMGLLDGMANTLFAYIAFMNYVAVGSAITALGPIFIALLGYALYRDRLTRLQMAGFVVMVAGAVVLSVL